MKISKFVFLFLLAMLFFTSTLFAQHSILGDAEACYTDCKIYDLSGGQGGPYYWKSTGEFQGSNQGTQVEICWTTIGSNTITLVDFSAPVASQNEKIDVTVSSIPKPKVIPPKYPTCGRRDSIDNPNTEQEFFVIECLTACSESVAFYGFEENGGAITDWEVDGGTILTTSADGITVQWNPSGNGFIKLIETNSTGCVDSIFYCIEILEPLDVDILAFNGGINSINVCADQEVYLQALGSLEATNFEWQMGDGTFQYGANISTSYSQGGTYDLMLIGSSECKCFDTTFYQIIVDDNPGPEITCIGTTCGNEEHTYFAANTCGTYNWNISSNGTVTEGGGSTDDFITINWNNGPVGTVGLSTNGCSEAICASETVIQIPILDGSANIEGPTVACKDGYSSYTIQYYNGTQYNWNISGNGYIVDGYGTNQITVEWQDDPQSNNDAVITVNYENCYLECDGQASLNVNLKPRFDIVVGEKVCSNNDVYFNGFEGWNNATLTWTVTSPSGIVTTYTDQSFVNDSFSELGVHSVTAVDNAGIYCNDEVQSFFEVIEAPETPTSIEGPLVICLNEFYNYSVPLPGPNVTVIWRFLDGSTYKQVRSHNASIQWTSGGPYEIRVTYSRDDIFCRSDELFVSLETAQNATITGSDATCEDEIDTYSIGAVNGSSTVWEVIPNDAGSIIHNLDNTIDIMWHTPGNHQITSDYCGATLSFNVNVAPKGNNTILYDEEICPGELSTIISSIPATSSVIIKDELNNVIGTSVSEAVTPGKYDVVVTSMNGCEETIPVVIDTFIVNKVRVSSPDENAFCLPHPNVSIVALDTKDGYTYEWFFNGSSMGITTSSISTNQYGDYYVQVTDINGCTTISNTHTLHEWCGTGDPGGGVCTGVGGPLAPFGISLTCNNLQFSVPTFGTMSTSFTWQFDDPDSGVYNTSSETSPIHEFTNAGYYYVFVRGNVSGERGVNIFTVPAAARFDYEDACAGNDVQFRNHSSFIPGYDIISYQWTFGDPSSGANNTSSAENPTHNYSTPGTYTVILEIESSDGCLSSYDLEVIVEDGPIAEFLQPISACSDDGILFEAVQDEAIYTYEWNFDDVASGNSNTSSSPNAIHTFSNNGSYNVSLIVSDGNNCTQSISKMIDVTSSTLSGDIASNTLFPMCFGDEAMLTAPNGGSGYLWSNGDTGQTISVTEPGIYSVTITENTGCNYMPDPVNVVIEGIINTKIRATHLLNEFTGPSYFDSIEICRGERFTLSTTWISGASYAWSNASTSTFINANELSGLSAGRHNFNVTVTEPNSGCEIESKPLTVIIHELPDAIQVSSSSANPCEGEIHTLTIDNPDPNLIYYWNNGSSGINTTVTKAGYYTVTAKNKNGCERESSGIYVAPLPNANRINTGCMQACFPDTICIPNIAGAANYQWLLDGVAISGPAGSTKDLIANQAGEYQLVIENYNGCSDTSDIFSIEAEPSDQAVSGIVFIDDNNNGVWDVGEELLTGVPVNLYMGSVLEETTTTDNGGFYNFDPVSVSNPRIVIDTAGLGLNLTGGILEDFVDFIDCIEDKKKNFPLTKECSASSETLNLMTCSGETLIINNIVLQEGDTWTFEDENSSGCDSMTLVTVAAFPDMDVTFVTSTSCQDINSGILDISVMTGSGLQFAVDNNSSYTSSLQFDNLGPGMHMLWFTDENNCVKSYPFEIESAVTPQMTTVAQNTCEGDNTGTAEIIPISTGDYQFSIDGINFNSDTEFNNLAEGNFTIYVQEDNLCIYEYTVSIIPDPEPDFDFILGETCSTDASGTLEIVPLSPGTFEYSLDNSTFTNTLYFENLPLGESTLFVQETDGCTHSYTFEILPTVAPEIGIIPSNTCEGQNEGSILIEPLTLGEYEYSLDGVTYSNDLEFFNLSEGSVTVYVLEDGVCEFQFSSAIDVQPLPAITIDTENACTGESNGLAIINTSEVGLEYSLNQIDFSSNILIEDLAVGMHTVFVRSDNGCIYPIEFEVFETEGLDVEFAEPLLDCSIQQVNLAPVVLGAEGNISYRWSTGESDSTIIAQNSGQYSLAVTDKCETQEYTWDIQLEEITEDQPIYFPNIFSPNQDGVNECFVPVLGPETTILSYKLLIFDRWGNKYFETDDISECWDGRYNGQDVRTGVFVYYLEMDYTYCVEVENMKKYGDITVVF